jgi:predicted phosphodiesterase
MKTLLFGDIHGADLGPLQYVLWKESIDMVACTGDFDTVSSIRQYMDMIKNNPEIDFTTVMGNHEDGIYHNKLLDDKNFKRFGKTLLDMHEDLARDRKAHDFVGKHLKRPVQATFLNYRPGTGYYKTAVVHGGFGQDIVDGIENFLLAPFGIGRHKRDMKMWKYLEHEHEHEENFSEMKKYGYKVMLRGHDHEKQVAVRRENGKINLIKPSLNRPIYFEQGCMYTITSARYMTGNYVVIDSHRDKTTVTFRKFGY